MARIRLLFILNGIADRRVRAVRVGDPRRAAGFETDADRPADRDDLGGRSVLSITVWGHLGDVVLGRARTLRIAILGAAALLALFMLPFPLALVAALYVGYAAFNGAVGPLSDALAVNALRDPGPPVRQGPRARQRLVHRRGGVFGLLYGRVGYWPSGVLFVGVAIAIAVNAGGLPDLGRAKLSSSRRGGAVREVLAIQPALPRVLVAVGLAHVGVFAGFTFLSLRIVELGGGAPEVALSSAVAAAAEVGAMIVASRLVPRIGLRTLFTVSSLLYTVAFLLWAVLASPVAIIASRLISGDRLRRAVDRERDGDPDAAPAAAPGLGPGADLDDHGRARRLHGQRRRWPPVREPGPRGAVRDLGDVRDRGGGRRLAGVPAPRGEALRRAAPPARPA